MPEVSAGAVICTIKEKMVYYLIIKDRHGNYGFPKGHQEAGESLEETALREIREEAGIEVKILPGFKKVSSYTMPNGIGKEVHYFLSFYKKGEPKPQEGEVEEILILPFIKAYEKLSFPDTKKILEDAHRLLIYQLSKRQS
ncbi:MAG: NUDIX domain-containing protein [Erysipelotrichaceae bacterium]|nr:NUDIX domain-containing protein [Erysipelotrichaceae bacterium]